METIGIAVYRLLGLLSWVIVIKSFLTWLPDRGGRLYEMMSIVTEPIEAPIRNIMYKYTNGPVDFTPMIAILVIMLLRSIVLRALVF